MGYYCFNPLEALKFEQSVKGSTTKEGGLWLKKIDYWTHICEGHVLLWLLPIPLLLPVHHEGNFLFCHMLPPP